MIDLDTIKSVDNAEVPILHPVTGEKTGAFVTLASPDHPARKQAIAAASRRLREAGDKQDADLLDELTEASIAASVLGWRGIRMEGVDMEHSPQAALDLLKRPEMKWLRDQIGEQLARKANFIETSAQD